jgi:2-iminobutanoate/2-iminopropanoate deaminase
MPRRDVLQHRRCLAVLAAWVLGAPAGPAVAGDPEFYPVPGADGERLPFSDAVRVGNLLLLAGQLGNIPGTRRLAPGGIAGETRQTMENIKAALERRGAGLEDVVKCTVFLADIGDWEAMNEVYVTYFPGPKPARSAVGVNGLALDARTEIECVAVLGE